MLSNAVCVAVEKVFGDNAGKVNTGDHKIDVTVTVMDNISGNIVNADINGVVTKADDHERNAAISLKAEEVLAVFCKEAGIPYKAAASHIANIVKNIVNESLDKDAVKTFKAAFDVAKDAEAKAMPKTLVSGKQSAKVTATFTEEEEVSKAM